MLLSRTVIGIFFITCICQIESLVRLKRESEKKKKNDTSNTEAATANDDIVILADEKDKNGTSKGSKNVGGEDYDSLLKSLFGGSDSKSEEVQSEEQGKNGTKKGSDSSNGMVKDLLDSVKNKMNHQHKFVSNSLPQSYRLKNIRSFITPELLSTLARAGQEDTLVLAGNGFPADKLMDDHNKVIRLDGLPMLTILHEIMKLISISKTAQFPLLLMKPAKNPHEDPKIWSNFKAIIEGADDQKYQWAKLNQQKFFEEAAKAVAIIQTGEPSISSSIILTKGEISESKSKKIMNNMAEKQNSTTTQTTTTAAPPSNSTTKVENKKEDQEKVKKSSMGEAHLEDLRKRLKELEKNSKKEESPPKPKSKP